MGIDLQIGKLLQAYRSGELAVRDVIPGRLAEIRGFRGNPAWISVLSDAQMEPYLRRLEQADPNELPLYGIPFAIKDNIDLAGVPTTAACPEFAYTPDNNATVVQRLIDAGAVPLGKTNLDQFATGLVGTRSPYGACHSVFSAKHISGGSSAGSAVAVASGQVSFALGTDTAGSGRVPAAFNNLVGLKPSRGLLSNTGMVRACRSLDCIGIFAQTSADALRVFDQARGFDPLDEYSRELRDAPISTADHPCVGVPLEQQLQFFGDEIAQAAHQAAVERLREAGWQLVPTDFSPLFDAAGLLYQGPWVAERAAAFGDFAREHPDTVLPLIHQILAPAADMSSVEVFRAQYRLQELKTEADRLLAHVDFALTPTAPTHYRIDEIEADPIALNGRLGTYTNFMNLLDLSAVAVPAGFREDGLPWGITLFAPAFHDYRLLGYANRVQQLLGAETESLPIPETDDRLELAVCGAHMSGLPLNGQLLERDGVLLQKTRTAKGYRLYALAGGPPKRPGLVRDPESEYAIELEVWSLPKRHIGSLLELIPPPLGLGKVELQDGRWVNSFICEPWGTEGAEEISIHMSWRRYLFG